MLSIASLFKHALAGLLVSTTFLFALTTHAETVQELRIGVQFGLGYLPSMSRIAPAF